MDSPYQPGFGARPTVLVGREAQFARIQAVLTRVRNSGDISPTHLVFTGARGLGKTVTLSVAGDIAAEHNFIKAATAMDQVSDNIQLLAGAIAEAIAPLQHNAPATMWARLRERLASLSIEINAGVIKITSEGRARPPAPGLTAAQRQGLAGLIADAASIARTKDHAGLVLILDELQEAPHTQLVVLANAIQDAAQIPHTPLAVIAAGLPTTPELVMAAASFTERFDFRPLGRLDRPDAERALLEPALRNGVQWATPATEQALSAAGGSPYLIQYIGDETWIHAQPHHGSTITTEHVDAALNDIRDNLEAGMFRGRWQKATPAEQAVLIAVATTATAEGIATTAAISAALETTTRAWSMARQSLIDKGLLEPAGHGRLRFTMPGFADYVSALTAATPNTTGTELLPAPRQLPPPETTAGPPKTSHT